MLHIAHHRDSHHPKPGYDALNFALKAQKMAEEHFQPWLTDKNWGLGAETAPLQGIGQM